MDFLIDLAQEDFRRSIAGTIARITANSSEFARREGAFLKSLWDELSAIGFAGLCLDEANGGLGPASIERMIALEELGRAALPSPYTVSIAGAATLIELLGTAEQKHRWLPALASGEMLAAVLSPAHRKVQGPQGEYLGVPWGAYASVFAVVPEKIGDPPLLVEADTAGVTIEAYTSFDGTPTASIRLSRPAEGHAAGEPMSQTQGVDSASAWREALCRIGTCQLAEASGILAGLVEATTVHVRQREQFGAPLGTLQVVKHMLVDLHIAAVEVQSLSYLASTLAQQHDWESWYKAVALGKLYIAREAREAGQIAIQLHGAMGVSDEIWVSHAFKRLWTLGAEFMSVPDALNGLAGQFFDGEGDCWYGS